MKMKVYDSNVEMGNKDVLPYVTFGKRHLGPFLYAYTSWLYEEIMAAKIQKVFFLARDGYLMEKSFRLFLKKKGKKIDTQYVYFSRKSVRQTLLWKCDSYQAGLEYMSTSKFVSLGELLEYWGFSEQERIEIAKQYKLELTEEFLTAGLRENANLSALYMHLKEQIDIKSKKQDELLWKYVKQIGMKESCAIVDIGWHGKMQQYIELFFASHGRQLDCTGFYLGIQNVVSVSGKMKGFLYDSRHSRLRKSVLVFSGGYEKLFQSKEGSTYGYKEENGKVAPVFAPYEFANQPEEQNYIQAWQCAALGYVWEALGEEREADMTLAMPLIHIGKYPKLKHVKLFSFLYNDDGQKKFFVSQKSLLQYRPKELIHALYNSGWKTGFMKSVFKLPLPYYFVYCVMRK